MATALACIATLLQVLDCNRSSINNSSRTHFHNSINNNHHLSNMTQNWRKKIMKDTMMMTMMNDGYAGG